MMMKKKGWSAFLKRKQYVIAGALVMLAVVGTTMMYSSEQEQERERLEAEMQAQREQQRQEEELARREREQEEQEKTAEASSVIPPESADNAETMDMAELESDFVEEEEDIVRETSAKRETLHFSPEDGMDWPLEGNVLLNYSMDSTIYFPTLDQYKYNPAVVIAGEVNSKVYSVARGKVTSVLNDEVTGCTMTVDLGDGYQAVYGQLKEPNFKEGDYVEAGHVLGYVSEPTKYFSVEGSNLYFALQKDGEPVDPTAFFQ